MKLNVPKCKNAQPKEKRYKLFDGMGLYLEVYPTGRKYWRMTGIAMKCWEIYTNPEKYVNLIES